MKINFDTGGADVLDRVLKAYGFKTKLMLANHLNISSASLVQRYKRDQFPSDIVVRCMAETGASLEWLANGEGEFLPTEQQSKETILSDDTLEKLERLAALKKEGAITEQEFNALKAKLI
ncbi:MULTISPECIES: helix-turn-helix domain-containing protein [unclassified Gilliamella]|uniref:helix-turn-helix domain-containing protein n=1 Tax=unclassified Gilliamella TaxID=2685620 RepID=UPI0009BEFA81|nr:helix-turn-helix domain-containing protein [Gilliamella apicola]